MKKKWLNKVKKELEKQGYFFEERWRMVYGYEQGLCYIHRRNKYYLVTVSFCTGQLLVEILTRKELIYIPDSTIS